MTDERPILSVLLSMPAPDGTTRFVDQLSEGRDVSVNYVYFTWRNALLGRWTVFHAHWPEATIRANGKLRTIVKYLLFTLLLTRIAVRRPRIVRTLHNEFPHEPGNPVERFLLDRLDRHVDAYIRLNRYTKVPREVDVYDIPHGHYRGRFTQTSAGHVVAGRVLNFGLIRPYKGVDELLREFTEHASGETTLRVVGRPADATWCKLVMDAIDTDPRISANLSFVDDVTLAAEIGSAEVVVLPYRHMHNSGVVFVALSLGRPVVVPDVPVNRDIQQEVGRGWVYLFKMPFEWKVVEAAMTDRESRVEPPRLERRDWDKIGALHVHAYRGTWPEDQDAG